MVDCLDSRFSIKFYFIFYQTQHDDYFKGEENFLSFLLLYDVVEEGGGFNLSLALLW